MEENSLKDDDIYINIIRDYSHQLGSGLISSGEFSGEDFYYSVLLIKYNEAFTNNKKLYIDITGINEIPLLFIKESFSKLLSNIGKNKFKSRIKFIGSDKDINELISKIHYVADNHE